MNKKYFFYALGLLLLTGAASSHPYLLLQMETLDIRLLNFLPKMLFSAFFALLFGVCLALLLAAGPRSSRRCWADAGFAAVNLLLCLLLGLCFHQFYPVYCQLLAGALAASAGWQFRQSRKIGHSA